MEPFRGGGKTLPRRGFKTGDKKSGTHKGVPRCLVNAISEFSNTV